MIAARSTCDAATCAAATVGPTRRNLRMAAAIVAGDGLKWLEEIADRGSDRRVPP